MRRGRQCGALTWRHEDLPRELHAEHVDKVLEITHADHSALGRRDYAILTLLATYGLRAGEVIGLRLEECILSDHQLGAFQTGQVFPRLTAADVEFR